MSFYGENNIYSPQKIRRIICVFFTRNIDGIVEMMLDATQRYEIPLTEERLFGWHAALFPTGYSGAYKIDVAPYRKGEMQIVSGATGTGMQKQISTTAR